jgi:hypothetical protein
MNPRTFGDPTASDPVRIDILYFDGCPHIDQTVERVSNIVDGLGLDATLETIEVADDAEARDLGFVGSPTVRIDGHDIEPDAESRQTVGLGCRLYSSEQGPTGVPPSALIKDGLKEAAS